MTKKAQKLISYYQGLWHAVLGTYELLIKLCKMLYNNFYLIKQMRKYCDCCAAKVEAPGKEEVTEPVFLPQPLCLSCSAFSCHFQVLRSLFHFYSSLCNIVFCERQKLFEAAPSWGMGLTQRASYSLAFRARLPPKNCHFQCAFLK